ncbi:hypothetical protein EXN66_Car014854 [Channa argus]|uniref:Uncharacterized protein n=1 Tax=Channa argus TaxID=215402 RepID=A0A6G1Q9J3_CHAAH|nr:hypothetical protein EXN66_Car014854 [Channa argus]
MPEFQPLTSCLLIALQTKLLYPCVLHLPCLLGGIYNGFIFTGHPLLLLAKWVKMDIFSANELGINFFFFEYPLFCSLVKDEVLNISTITSLGKVIQHLLPGVTQYCTLCSSWNMTWSFPGVFLFSVFIM